MRMKRSASEECQGWLLLQLLLLQKKSELSVYMAIRSCCDFEWALASAILKNTNSLLSYLYRKYSLTTPADRHMLISPQTDI